MARQPRYLLNRNGRYFARLVIPNSLRPFLDNKTELREALGPDRRVALSRLHSAVANLQNKIAMADRQQRAERGEPAKPGRYPLTVEQLALKNYNERLTLDEQRRNTLPGWADIGIDDIYVADLRAGIAGKLNDAALQELVGPQIERYRLLGNTTATFGSEEWRVVARAMCVSELEALARLAERDEGDYSGSPEHPLLTNAKPIEEEQPPVLIRDLFNRYIAELKANGKGEGAEKRWRPVIEDLIAFTRTTDARLLKKKVLVEWKDAKMKTLAPRTVRDVYFTALNAILNWAVANDILPDNPATGIKIKVAAKLVTRPKGFTKAEAQHVLKFSRSYRPVKTGNPQTEEAPQTAAAKTWAPLLCAFTGSRISEITQLRKEDVRGRWHPLHPNHSRCRSRKESTIP